MLVDRRILSIKPGRMEDALEVLTTERTRIDSTRAIRIYAPSVAAFDQIIVEFEFENWAECEEFWNTWGATPEADAFWEKWRDVNSGGGRREIWELAE